MWDACGLLKGMGTHAVVISSGTVGKINRALALPLPDLRPEPDTPPSWVAVGVSIYQYGPSGAVFMELRTNYVQFLTQSLAHSRCSSQDSHLFKKKFVLSILWMTLSFPPLLWFVPPSWLYLTAKAWEIRESLGGWVRCLLSSPRAAWRGLRGCGSPPCKTPPSKAPASAKGSKSLRLQTRESFCSTSAGGGGGMSLLEFESLCESGGLR